MTDHALPSMTPTGHTYTAIDRAYAFFNSKLFGGELPCCLVTLQRKAKSYGYFAGNRFATRDGSQTTDEIALNPNHFACRTIEEILSTLVHEMVHLWQYRLGTPPKSAYHNCEWANKMLEVGLIPSTTGEPGGKQTGTKVSHYIEESGRYEQAVRELLGDGFTLAYADVLQTGTREKKAASKTKYTCGECGANAWAKPGILLTCGECDNPMDEA